MRYSVVGHSSLDHQISNSPKEIIRDAPQSLINGGGVSQPGCQDFSPLSSCDYQAEPLTLEVGFRLLSLATCKTQWRLEKREGGIVS